MRNLALPIEDIDWHEHEAELDAGEQQVDEFDAVREVHPDAIARLEAAAGKGMRQPVAAGMEVAEPKRRQLAIGTLVLDRDVVGLAEQRRARTSLPGA